MRKVSISFGDLGTIAGFCLSYSAKDHALSFFDFIRTYLSATGEIPRHSISVSIVNISNETCSVEIEFGLGDWMRNIYIEKISVDCVDNIRQSLQIFPYYLLIAGYGDEDVFTILPISQYHLFISSIKINQEIYTGVKNANFPWRALIQSDIIFHESSNE